MHITDLDVFVVGTPEGTWGGRYFDVFERHIEGENPHNIEKMYRSAHASGFTLRPDPTVMGAFSGLEMACWDIVGKALEQPIHMLLGGQTNDRLRAYSYIYPFEGQAHDPVTFFSDPDKMAESALKMVEEGYTAPTCCLGPMASSPRPARSG